jgi:hypothetical protein
VTSASTASAMGVADFKGKSKVFVRTYGFLASIMP